MAETVAERTTDSITSHFLWHFDLQGSIVDTGRRCCVNPAYKKQPGEHYTMEYFTVSNTDLVILEKKTETKTKFKACPEFLSTKT